MKSSTILNTMRTFNKFFAFALIVLTLMVGASNAQTLRVTGLPIQIGDTLEQVQQAMQTNAMPAPYESKINPNGTRLPFNTKGIFVFFDATGKVAIIRLEKNFSGSVNGLKYGETITSVTGQLGTPHFRNVTVAGVETLTYDFENRVNFEYNSNKTLDVIFLRKSGKSSQVANAGITPSTSTVALPESASTEAKNTVMTSSPVQAAVNVSSTDQTGANEKSTPTSLVKPQSSTLIQAAAGVHSMPVPLNNTPQINKRKTSLAFLYPNHDHKNTSTIGTIRSSEIVYSYRLMTLIKENNINAFELLTRLNDNINITILNEASDKNASHIITINIPKATITTSTFKGNQSSTLKNYTINVSVLDALSRKEIYRYTSDNVKKGWFTTGVSDKEAVQAIFDDMRSKGLF